jgi:NitT/TauT family transport system substrate-binding protein
VALSAIAGLLGVRPKAVAAEPPPETSKLRMTRIPGICIAPQYVAQELLVAEGFTDLEYVDVGGVDPYPAFASGKVDITMGFVPPFLMQVDAGVPIVLLAGIHAGCFELFGTGPVRAIRDLKDRSVAVPALGSAHQLFVASMATYVGVDPRKDIKWVTHPIGESAAVLVTGKADALVGFPPVPQELRARAIGRVIVNSSVDRPWSQYFCCIVASNRDFVSKHPIATKRALRAMLKATDVCATGRSRPLAFSSIEGSRRNTSSPSRRSARSRTTAGVPTTSRTRCASTHSGFTRQAWSDPARRGSLPRVPTGASSTS